jgi:hypothetical protein
MSNPSNTVAPEVYLQAAAAANNFESFGRSIASSVLQASADATHGIEISASAEPLPATHGSTCVTVRVNVNGVAHQVVVCLML